MTNVMWLLQFVRPYRWRLLLAAGLGFLAILANVGLMGTSGYLIAAAALHPATILLLWTPIVGVRFFGISRSVFRYLERLVSHDLTFHILARVRVWFYDRIEQTSNGTRLLEHHGSADVLTRAVTDVESLQNLYLRVLAPPLIALFVGVMSVLWIARYSGMTAIWFAVFFVITGAVVPWISLHLGRQAGKAQVLLRSDFQSELGDALRGLTELTMDGQVDATIRSLANKQTDLTQAARRGTLIQSAGTGAFVFFTNVSVWAALLVLIPLVSLHAVKGVEVPSLLFIILASFEAVMPIPASVQAMNETLAAARRIKELAGHVSEEIPAANGGMPVTNTEVPAMSASELEQGPIHRLPLVQEGDSLIQPPVLWMRDVQVRYDDALPDVLRGVTLRLAPGERVAVVGESGSGKSTIFNMLLGLCTYHKGSVMLGGYELRDLPVEFVRNQFAAVTQDAFLFHVSVADNLRLAKPGASDDELCDAAKTAQILDLIESLPDGFDTLVGENGARFSGGERQRIALARALLRGAPILLLDEPTNGLDAVTEAEFLEALWSAVAEKAVIYITHRLAGLESVDTILVLQDGRAVEAGSPHQLLSQPDSLFRRMRQMAHEQIDNK
ncbi:thiol reductant ABC exporter subunit CydC [Alicyclobacillus ferrooxydans]|uniref:thiol reductant ABC exporter subunit CydC n=1 Tax=Alicyclobacillus ferrooxydans TaxID=471514 RepID=UPI0006D55AC3|nr:thiol reductant ABC exporter subunit CydC [Alicyclobacillus ferrooxydans]